MKRLITFEPHHTETFEPVERFLNAYLEGRGSQMLGYDQATLEGARRVRDSGAGEHGITLRIARDVNGDFIVEKVEEF